MTPGTAALPERPPACAGGPRLHPVAARAAALLAGVALAGVLGCGCVRSTPETLGPGPGVVPTSPPADGSPSAARIGAAGAAGEADPAADRDLKRILRSKTTDATSAIRRIYESALRYFEGERAARDGGTRPGEPPAREPR